MLMKGIFCITFYLINVHFSKAKDDSSVVVSLSPDEVINSFQAVVKSGFLNQLANEFASKAAVRLVQEMRKKGKQLLKEKEKANDKEKPILKVYNVNRQWSPMIDKSDLQEHVLDEEEALTLMEEPSPDGDDFEKSNLSDDEDIENNTKKPMPVVGVMKINGKYFRRYPGFLQYLF